MTYNVFGGTLNLTQPTSHNSVIYRFVIRFMLLSHQ